MSTTVLETEKMDNADHSLSKERMGGEEIHVAQDNNAVTVKKEPSVRDAEIKEIVPTYTADDDFDCDETRDDTIIVTGADAARHLLSVRDDRDPALTFRSIFLATILAAFQAVMSEIYQFKPTYVSIQGTFIVIISYFMGNAWANLLPRGDRLETHWRSRGGQGVVPHWIKVVSLFNYGPWGLKEHAICSITANSASNAIVVTQVYSAQELFYNLPLSPVTVVLATLSIGLFGYGIAGMIRSFAVWHVEAVYWGSLPVVKSLQSLHWDKVNSSKPLRYFWYAFAGMFSFEWFPAYVWPWLNSISIPCLASMHATGNTAATLTNLFGGSIPNEGLGLFNFGFDWQYITSFQTALPLKYQVNQALGYLACYIVMIGIYYGNGWGSKSLPFMSSRLLTADGSPYPVSKVFNEGILDESALEKYGPPRITGSFAYGMFMANAAIGAMMLHCILFWGKDVINAFKGIKTEESEDPHHEHMAKNYKETPAWWYGIVLLASFVLGLIVVIKEDITLPVWAYVVALILGIIFGPFSALLFSRYGNGIATNNLSKLVAGLLLPGRPIGNMYFAAWSHNVISNTVNLCNDLKMGEYLKIPPRVMFMTQIYGTALGSFVNYAVMISIVKNNKEVLTSGNGDASWSGATLQGYNTNAASWAMARYLYTAGNTYAMVPAGLAIGAACVIVHRLVVYVVPRIRGVSLSEFNFPQFIQFAGYIPYNSPQTCVIANQITAGFFVQWYLRNYHPRIFRDYSYLVAAAFDGAALMVLFILSFAVFGAGGPSIPFPQWWGNNVNGNYDFCPTTD